MSDNDSSKDDLSHLCCCAKFHVKTGALLVAIAYAVIIVSNLAMRAIKSEEVEWNWQLLFLVSDTVSVMSLFYGLHKQHPAFLQPFTVLSLVTVSFFCLLTIFYCSAMIDSNSYAGEQVEILLADKVPYFAELLGISPKKVIVYTGLFGTLLYAGILIIHIWFMVLVVNCAKYFRLQWDLQKEDAEATEEMVALEANVLVKE